MKYRQFKSCENCKILQRGQFIYDSITDDYICTICGCIVRKFIYSDRKLTYHEKFNSIENLKSNKFPNHEKRLLMLNRFFPKIDKLEFYFNKIEKYGQILNFNEIVFNKAKYWLKKFPKLIEIKPRKKVIFILLILSQRSYNYCLDFTNACKILNINGVAKLMLRISKILGVSQLYIPIYNISRLLFLCGFKYKYVKYLKKFYFQAREKNKSIGSDTLIALILIRFYIANKKKSNIPPHKITLKYITKITNTSLASIKSYVFGAIKNTLFTKNNLTFLKNNHGFLKN